MFLLLLRCASGAVFTIFRLNAHWHIGAWDITALRFAIAFVILIPIAIYKKDLAFLCTKQSVIFGFNRWSGLLPYGL